MAFNYLWNPPTDELNNKPYIYPARKKDQTTETYHKAMGLLDRAKSLLSENLRPSLQDLYNLAVREQKKEDELLNKKLKLPDGTSREDGQRIKQFNQIYSYIDIFNRNITKIEQSLEAENSSRIDITQNFTSYLDKPLRQYLESTPPDKIKESDLKKIIEAAIEDMLTAEDEVNKEIIKAYEPLLNNLQGLASRSQLIDEVFETYLGGSWKKFQYQLKELGNNTPKPQMSQQKGNAGFLLESLLDQTLKTLNFNVKQTGASGQKADLIIASLNITFPETRSHGFNSVRADFVSQWKKMYENVQLSAGEIVEISAKNYTLKNNNWSGFTAQRNITIDNFASTLSEYGYKEDKLNALIFALLNTGPDTLQKELGEVSRNISTLIAYFLFDDIDMDIGTSINAIHLFNLDGVYVPLSSFLFAAYRSLSDFEQLSNKYVQINYKPKVVFPKGFYGSEEAWETARKQKMTQENLTIHFFKDFASYIKSLGMLNF